MQTGNRTKEKSTENSHGINDETLCRTTDPTRSHHEEFPYKVTYGTKIHRKQRTHRTSHSTKRDNKYNARHSAMPRNSIPCNEVKNKVTTQRACRVPKTHGSLHTKFVLKGSQRRGSVVGPIAPSASSQAILHEQDVLCTCMRETRNMFIMFIVCYYFIS